MIEFRTGDILQAEAEALVNTVNCVGFMGRGIALAFKEAFPDNFKDYERACKRGEVMPGRMLVHRTSSLTGPRLIINFPTKRHWRGKSRIEDIEAGLVDLERVVREEGIRSVAIPPLGCGLGGLDWLQVKPLIEASVKRMEDVEAIIYEPGGQTDQAQARATTPPAMTAARAVLVLALRRYLGAMLDPSVSLLELHKLLYFVERAGEPLQLHFRKGHYGPYAENLRFLLQKINHYYVEADLTLGDDPQVPVQLVPSAEKDANEYLANKVPTQQRLDKVFELIEGWESPHGLELLATVYWLASEEHIEGRDAIVQAAYNWNRRKKQFTPRQIGLAYETLRERHWIPV
jgi:O-acetyl-ADP-ribose deacetylase (regulator of RNase III)